MVMSLSTLPRFNVHYFGCVSRSSNAGYTLASSAARGDEASLKGGRMSNAQVDPRQLQVDNPICPKCAFEEKRFPDIPRKQLRKEWELAGG
jgi:hypothetical protein